MLGVAFLEELPELIKGEANVQHLPKCPMFGSLWREAMSAPHCLHDGVLFREGKWHPMPGIAEGLGSEEPPGRLEPLCLLVGEGDVTLGFEHGSRSCVGVVDLTSGRAYEPLEWNDHGWIFAIWRRCMEKSLKS